MEEEEILGVNLDELSSLFTSSDFLGGRSFGWGLAPYKNVVMNDDGVMVKDDSVVLYIDPLGEANLNSKLWMFQKTDPLDAYVEPEFSKENLFVKGLSKAIPGVPPFGIIALPWYDLESSKNDLKTLKFPDDTPEGFVPCSGYVLDINGQEFRLPQLIARTESSIDDASPDKTVYIAPPGCTYMIRLPYGTSSNGINARTGGLFGGNNYFEFKGELVTWGNPLSPFPNTFF